MKKIILHIMVVLFSILITTDSIAELTLPDSTIIFSKTFYKDDNGESAEIAEKQLWHMSNKSNWEPRLLITGKQIPTGDLSSDGQHILWFNRNDGYTYEHSLSIKKSLRLFKGAGARYSPSGNLIAFISQREVSLGKIGRSIEVYNLKTKQIRLIVKGKPFPNQFHSIRWLNDTKLVFLAISTDSKSMLTFNMEGQQIRETSLPVNLSNFANLALSPDMTKWAFQATDNNVSYLSRIYMMNSDGSNVKKIYEDKKKLYHFAPVWSPYGEFIAFSTGYEGSRRGIIVDIKSGDLMTVPGFIIDWSAKLKLTR